MTYKEMINNIINTRGKHGLDPNSYFEMHHIVPSAWGGEGDYYDKVRGRTTFGKNSKHKNCIWVTPEEHFELHRLLWTENRGDRAMLAAFKMMSNKGTLTAEEYGELRRDYVEQLGEISSQSMKKYWEGKTVGVACIETGRVYNSVLEATLDMCGEKNLSANISRAATNMDYTAFGYHWAFTDPERYEEAVNKLEQKGNREFYDNEVCAGLIAPEIRTEPTDYIEKILETAIKTSPKQGKFTEREANIIISVIVEKKTFEEIGKERGVTRSCIHHQYKNALSKLQKNPATMKMLETLRDEK